MSATWVTDAALEQVVFEQGVPVRIQIDDNPPHLAGWIGPEHGPVGSVALAAFLRAYADKVESDAAQAGGPT